MYFCFIKLKRQGWDRKWWWDVWGYKMKPIVELWTEFDFYKNGGTDLEFEKGNGKAAENGNAPSNALSFDETLQQLEQKIIEGKIQKRDLKLRLDGPVIYFYEGKLPSLFAGIKFGATSYLEWKEDVARTPEESQRLQQKGEQVHRDYGYYFSRGLGVTVIPMTADNQVIVGIRISEDYDGAVHGAAGWLTFSSDFSAINSSLRPRNEGLRELEEELAVQRKEVKRMDLMGLVAYPHTLESDFVYLARLQSSKPAEYFVSGAWKQAVDAREHRDLIVLSTPDELYQLVNEGKSPQDRRKFEVLASTAYGLTQLAEKWKEVTEHSKRG